MKDFLQFCWEELVPMTLFAVAFLLVVLGLIVAIGKPISEATCNQRGEEYGLPADYRLLSTTCYVTLPNGNKIDVANIRGTEPTNR